MSGASLNKEHERAFKLTNKEIFDILADRAKDYRAKEVLETCVTMMKVAAKGYPDLKPGLASACNLLELYMEHLDPSGRLALIPADAVAKAIFKARADCDMVAPPAPLGTIVANQYSRKIKPELEPEVTFSTKAFVAEAKKAAIPFKERDYRKSKYHHGIKLEDTGLHKVVRFIYKTGSLTYTRSFLMEAGFGLNHVNNAIQYMRRQGLAVSHSVSPITGAVTYALTDAGKNARMSYLQGLEDTNGTQGAGKTGTKAATNSQGGQTGTASDKTDLPTT